MCRNGYGWAWRCALLCCALLVVQLGLGADEGLELLFAQAQAEPDGKAVAMLVQRCSARIRQLDAERGCALAERLSPWSSHLFLSAQRLPGMAGLGIGMHRVRRKETIASIARHFRMPVGLLYRLNEDLDDHSCTIGRVLKVLDGRRVPLHVIVVSSRFCLEVWRANILVAAFPAGLGGTTHPTPLGRTTIACCVRNPQWRDPDSGHVYQAQDPGNVLGGYWIGFKQSTHGRFHGIGVHGFTAEQPEEWLGKAASHGCVRLRQDDIATLFDLVRPGERVEVLP